MMIPQFPQYSQDCLLSDLEDGLYEEDDENDENDPNAFRIRDALPAPTHKNYTTQELHHMIHQGDIDLNPEYQRDVVWPESKQVNLVDSLWKNIHIPSIVFVVHKDEDGDEQRICVDGKQRLTSMQRFLDGQVPHKDTKKTWWFTIPVHSAGKANKFELPERAKAEFKAKVIQCVEYRNLEEGSEREIFRRVQLGMTLTTAEKWRAISSPWTSWINELQNKHIFVDGGLAENLKWTLSRGTDFQNVLNLVFLCEGYTVGERRIYSPAQIEKFLRREDNPDPEFKERIEEVLVDIWRLADDKKYHKCFASFNQLVAPVEFAFVGALLFSMQERSLSTKANAVHTLRFTIHSQFSGQVRNNNKVGNAAWSFINTLRRSPDATNLVVPDSGTPTSRNGKKRKSDDTDFDSDYRHPGRAAKKVAKSKSKAK
ncbi:hypothetical protein FA15DRAFT_664562 [Coprinopsis marcescibilis]|uniref:GmrSD restriction endonucleases N-terminal domain-containing protein n=1 Tax=Coprinopsis marcescibilis TaxID=230819 RepID=A0A5C3L7E7_COPMA|nr:hypothetical protein FA15DRAFT_664562 [Coprinopsis marcescibilis]